MKSIDEACKTTFVYDLTDQAMAADAPEVVMKISADIDRWTAIDDDVRNCKWIQIFVANIIAMHASGRIPLGECIMATCCQMVQVGMEMARVELPEPRESVPGRRERDRGYTGV